MVLMDAGTEYKIDGKAHAKTIGGFVQELDHYIRGYDKEVVLLSGIFDQIDLQVHFSLRHHKNGKMVRAKRGFIWRSLFILIVGFEYMQPFALVLISQVGD